ncbi:MAG: beta-galactosidase [Roseburia sp.]|nr:beta-galactosidase [Roseburia sp.]MCM1099675.1 beta-galactosidase [Ruminococcus flavefaciens]
MERIEFMVPAGKGREKLLPASGWDAAGNLYQADSRSLLINGRRVMPVMGEFHFSRLEPSGWREAILKMRAGGVNIVATYVFWNHHEERQGEWDFTGCRDLRRFLSLCGELDMKVWLRIGPWAHGECRHGGFPDYVQYADGFEKRTDDPKYLELVDILYRKIGEEARGMMCKDGGPVIGIQLENEYGHCGGPSDRAEQARHMKTLYRLAKEAGLDTPYYTATAWGGACTIDETLQVLSGYVDAPWEDSVKKLPPMENYLFIPYRDDANTGSDFHRADASERTIREDYPYLTAELGGGLQATSHRRPILSGADNAAHIVTVLGSGAALIGYYMYHGGINPTGRYTDLNEAQCIGGNTTVPRKSYDFDACVNEAGKLSESYGALKKYHHLLASFGEELADASCILPENLPESAGDEKTIRAALRWNEEKDMGFLFVNNHVRNLRMKAHDEAEARIHFADGTERSVEKLRFTPGRCYILPVHLRSGSVIIRGTSASLLGRLGKRIFLYSQEEEPWLDAEDPEGLITVLTEEEADRSFLYEDGLYLTETADSCIIEDQGVKKLIGEKGQKIRVYREDGGIEEFFAEPGEAAKIQDGLQADFEQTEEDRDKNGEVRSRTYRLRLNGLKEVSVNQIYLNVQYLGDRAEVWLDGELADDWFTTGRPWNIALRRFDYPSELTIRIYDSAHTIPCRFGQEVYYDLPVEPGCELRQVRLVPEFAMTLG